MYCTYGWRFDRSQNHLNVVVFDHTGEVLDVSARLQVHVHSNIDVKFLNFQCIRYATETMNPVEIATNDIHLYVTAVSPPPPGSTRARLFTVKVVPKTALFQPHQVIALVENVRHVDSNYFSLLKHVVNWREHWNVKVLNNILTLHPTTVKASCLFFWEDDSIFVCFSKDPGTVTAGKDFMLYNNIKSTYIFRTLANSFNYLNGITDICSHSKNVSILSVYVNEVPIKIVV